MTISHDTAAELARVSIHTVKALAALRHVVPHPVAGVDTTTYPVLFSLCPGPQRVSALADLTHCDISTTSRQISHLVALGYAEKVADPADGRAQLVALTPAGRQVIDQLSAHRGRLFQQMLHGWTDQDAVAFTAYLARLGEDIDTFRTTLATQR